MNTVRGRPINVLISLVWACIAVSAVSTHDALAADLRGMTPDLLPYLAARADVRAEPGHRDALSVAATLAYGDAAGGHDGDDEKLLQRLADDSRDPLRRYRASLLSAGAAMAKRHYAQGLRYLARAQESPPPSMTSKDRQLAAIVAASTYARVGHPELALHYLGDLDTRVADARLRCGVLELRSRVLASAGGNAIRPEDFVQAREACVAAGELPMATLVEETRVAHLARRGNTSQALAALAQTLAMARESRSPSVIADVLAKTAELLSARGDRAGAANAAREILELPRGAASAGASASAHLIAYQQAMLKGDAGSALAHYREYVDAARLDAEDARAQEHAFRMNSLEVRARERTALLLRRENAALQLQHRLSAQREWSARLSAVLLATLVLVLAYWAGQSRRSQRTLRRLGETDVLTGIGNRRHFQSCAGTTLDHCMRAGEPASMLLVDLDQFKQINDQCSHAVGDWVLKNVGRLLRDLGTAPIVVGRVGGEEFAVLIPEANAERGLAFAERLRAGISELDLMGGGCFLPVSASIGVSCTTGSGYDYESLMRDADTAMYTAKLAGRDRALVADADGGSLKACA